MRVSVHELLHWTCQVMTVWWGYHLTAIYISQIFILTLNAKTKSPTGHRIICLMWVPNLSLISQLPRDQTCSPKSFKISLLTSVCLCVPGHSKIQHMQLKTAHKYLVKINSANSCWRCSQALFNSYYVNNLSSNFFPLVLLIHWGCVHKKQGFMSGVFV